MEFEIRTDDHGVIWVSGELDLVAAEPFLAEAERSAEGEREVVIDLRDVTFLDSSGLRAILALTRSSGQRDVVLRNAPRPVRKLVHIAGVEGGRGLRLADDEP